MRFSLHTISIDTVSASEQTVLPFRGPAVAGYIPVFPGDEEFVVNVILGWVSDPFLGKGSVRALLQNHP